MRGRGEEKFLCEWRTSYCVRELQNAWKTERTRSFTTAKVGRKNIELPAVLKRENKKKFGEW